jgi:hypothetical protein
MELRNIVMLLIIIVLLGMYFTENYKKMEKLKLVESTLIKEDTNDLYINPYLTNKEPNLNVIKKYSDNKINIINNLFNNEKNMYDTPINPTNNNSNHNNLLHFINFLI